MIFNYLKVILYMFLVMLGLTIIVTIFNYIGLLNGFIFSIVKLLIPIIAIIYGGYLLGRKSIKKGYLEGIKLAIITIIFLLILNLIFKNSFSWQNIIYFLILIGSSMLSSMIGINKNKSNG